MEISFPNVSITGIATAIPQRKFDLHEMDSLYGENEIDRIMSSTGIYKVRVADEKICTSDLCVEAANNLIASMVIDPKSIDGIVFVSQTPDYVMPATSVLLQHRLGLPKTAVAMDINYGCSGYIYGLYQVAMLLSTGGCERVLLCNGDVTTRLVNERDRASRMVFGDGASASIIERGGEGFHFVLKTDGSGANNLIIPAGGFRNPSTPETAIAVADGEGNFRSENNIYMNGMEIMSFAIKEVPIIIKELLSLCNWDKDEVGTYALHQANKFMLDYLRKKLKVAVEAVPIAVEEIGNTSSASIPIALSFEHKRLTEQKRLQKVIACGFGVGLSWGAVALDLSKTLILESLEVE